MYVRTRACSVMIAVASCVCSLALMLSGASAAASAASPSVTPASGGGGVAVLPGFTSFDPAVVGYKQSEVFLSGTASAYETTAPVNGKYGAVATSTAPYTTRAVVMRPVNGRRFNGTVIVEWLNVTADADSGVDWMIGHNELVREGFVWVGVSAQKAGVDALKSTDPTRGDPVRYANLSQPGDNYSFDIFSQAGQAIRDHAATILGGLKPKHIIAVGASLSAGRLRIYIDAVHPLVHVYDGFLVHSLLEGGPAIRDDVGVPVLVLQTETDVSSSGGTARQPDTNTYRLWEGAGTAHGDLYFLGLQSTDTGDGKSAIAMLASMQHPTNQPNPTYACGTQINTGPTHYILDAALYRLNRWVAQGILPPVAPRLQTTGVSPFAFATDANGNVLGGIRTPAVDAPVATLSGLGGTPPATADAFETQTCSLTGTTVPFTPSQLQVLYPNHRKFVSAWTKATNSAHAAGFLTDADAKELKHAAGQSNIGN